MSKKTTLIIIGSTLSVIMAVVSFAAWRIDAVRHFPPPAHSVVAGDHSDSSACGCEGLTALVKSELEDARYQRGSTISVMLTGSAETSNEPVSLGTYSVPIIRNQIEGRSGVDKERKAIIDLVRRRCKETSVAQSSPIYLLTERAAQHLHAAGCDGRSACRLVLASDLEETVEQSIRKAINDRHDTKDKSSIAARLPTPIDNSAIEVIVFGVAQTRGIMVEDGSGKKRALTPPHDQRRVTAIEQTWGSLFTEPIKFEPHCPSI
jgi:hypothetical protein